MYVIQVTDSSRSICFLLLSPTQPSAMHAIPSHKLPKQKIVQTGRLDCIFYFQIMHSLYSSDQICSKFNSQYLC